MSNKKLKRKLDNCKTQVKDFMIDHSKIRRWSKWIGIFLVEVISAFIFAYGFKAFTAPDTNIVKGWSDIEKPCGEDKSKICSITSDDVASPIHLISGGASGVSQTIIKFISIFTNVSSYESILVSVLYFCLNIPILILAFKKISKQFTFFTLVNVGLTSLFNSVIPSEWIYNVVNLYSDLLARALFAGICTGVSSSLAMIVGTSTGGYDCITIYISEKKSTSVGKYSILLNSITVLSYVLFSVIAHNAHPEFNTQNPSKLISTALYTIVYFFVSAKVIDLINTKNKKQELQIFTSDSSIPTILIHTFPHSCTVVDSKGAFSGAKNYVVYMVISKNEAKKAISMVKNADPKAFVSIIDINQVYGRFYIKPFD